jgi:hypothetical protein
VVEEVSTTEGLRRQVDLPPVEAEMVALARMISLPRVTVCRTQAAAEEGTVKGELSSVVRCLELAGLE